MDNQEFQPGDIVECVDDDEGRKVFISKGSNYEVASMDGGYVHVKSQPVPGYNASRFKLIRSAATREQAKRDSAVAETLAIAGIDPAPPLGGLTGYRAETVIVDDVEAAPRRDDPRMSREDMVNLPKHYARFAIEPIRFICENSLDFMRGNAVKYILRCDAKNGREDLQKARRYLDMFERFHFDKDPDWWKIGQGAPA